ncbi:TPA: acetyl-CoA C-acetyltransferase [Raoultella planticola]|nr:acetyl-CoA C-acetyltransferase [Raoultella planticola]
MREPNEYIVSAFRTPVGAFGGQLAELPAPRMGAHLIREMLEQTGVQPQEVDEVILGQVLTAGCGQNPARQSALWAGLPESTPALTINTVCGSGLKALQLAAQSILAGDADLVIAGGQENMSLAPHFLPGSRRGTKMGEWSLVDSMDKDGLWDVFNNYHMGQTAENIAKQYGISRQEQDEFACSSQSKAAKALAEERFASEIIPVAIQKKGGESALFAIDEYPRSNTTLERLSKLRPAFKVDGTVTAGNSSGVNDGAAVVMLASEKKVRQLGLVAMARLVSFATAGVVPDVMGTGSINASCRALERSGWQLDELDLIESNEAFAAQAIAVNREMGWDLKRVNVNGGAIALGHPIGASGTRIFVSLLHELKRGQLKKGLATLCIGGGMGIAVTVEML